LKKGTRLYGKNLSPEILTKKFAEQVFIIDDILYIIDENKEIKNAQIGKTTELEKLLYRVRCMGSNNRTWKAPTTTTVNTTMKYLISGAENKKQANSRYIRFLNGDYDIETRTLIPLDANKIILNVIPHDYNSNPNNENIEFVKSYLQEICIPLDNDNNNTLNINIDEKIQNEINKKVNLLLQTIALSMIRHSKNNKIINIFGAAGTGKSTFGKLLEKIIQKSNISNLQPYEFAGQFNKQALLNKTLNLAFETPDNELTKTGINFLKTLSSGDTVSTDVKHNDFISFTNKAQLVFIGNNKLNFGDNIDRAVKDRLVNIELSHRFRDMRDEYRDILKSKLSLKANIETFIYLSLKTIDKNGYIFKNY
jgi:phage/plasmid-associated DNA primase